MARDKESAACRITTWRLVWPTGSFDAGVRRHWIASRSWSTSRESRCVDDRPGARDGREPVGQVTMTADRAEACSPPGTEALIVVADAITCRATMSRSRASRFQSPFAEGVAAWPSCLARRAPLAIRGTALTTACPPVPTSARAARTCHSTSRPLGLCLPAPATISPSATVSSTGVGRRVCERGHRPPAVFARGRAPPSQERPNRLVPSPRETP